MNLPSSAWKEPRYRITGPTSGNEMVPSNVQPRAVGRSTQVLEGSSAAGKGRRSPPSSSPRERYVTALS